MNTPSSRDFDVVIVGAGVIGAAMASLLMARNVSTPGRVAIIADRFATAAADADWDLRVFALSRASERLLKVCGVWDALPVQRIFPYERMCVWDAGGEPSGRVPCGSTARKSANRIWDSSSMAAPCNGTVCKRRGPPAPCCSRPALRK